MSKFLRFPSRYLLVRRGSKKGLIHPSSVSTPYEVLSFTLVSVVFVSFSSSFTIKLSIIPLIGLGLVSLATTFVYDSS